MRVVSISPTYLEDGIPGLGSVVNNHGFIVRATYHIRGTMGGFSRVLVRVFLSHPSEKYATVKLDSIFANIGIKITTNGALMAFQSWLGYKHWIWSHASSSNLTNSPRLKHNSCVAASPCQFWAIKAFQRKCEVFVTCPCWCPTMDVIFCWHKVSWSFMNLSRSWWVLQMKENQIPSIYARFLLNKT